MPYAVSFIAAVACSYLLTIPVRALALRFDIVDHPEKRKIHEVPIPLMGGLAIFISFMLISVPVILLQGEADSKSLVSFLGLAAGGAIIVLLGVYDDIRGLRARTKFAWQAIAALMVMSCGVRFDVFTNPLGASFEIGWLSLPLTLLWIVGVTNAINLIDGLDGLAAGIGTIAAIGLFFITQNPLVTIVTIVLAGSGLGFLGHNFYPARIFLGDSGSMFMGFVLAVVSIIGSLKATTATVLILPIILLGLPLFDTLFAIFRRARRRVNPFKADREHIHHRLVRIGLHHPKVVLVLYFACSYLAVTAYAIAQLPYQAALVFFVLLMMGAFIGLRTLQFVEERLETALSAIERNVPVGRGAGRRKSEPASDPGRNGFTTFVCEIEGFSEDLTLTGAMREVICEDIRSMLSRRMRVQKVIVEPSGTTSLLVLVRTDPIVDAMGALVRNGVIWYFEDRKEQFSNQPEFPRITWLRGELNRSREGQDKEKKRAARKPARVKSVVPIPHGERP